MERTPCHGEMVYTTAQVAGIAGVSVRQLQWWDEKGILRPIQDRHQRLYNEDQLATAVKLGKMRKAGVTLRQARRILKSSKQWNTVVAVWRPTLIGTTLVVPR